MPDLKVRNLAGEEVDTIAVSDEVFAAKVNLPLMHQAMVRVLAGQRSGTQKAKTRGEVRGGGEKPWRQKGTGRARQGTRRSPLWRGGGVVFAPHPRSYAVRMPKKMRRAATRSALTSRIHDEGLVVVSDLLVDEIRTKAIIVALANLEVSGKVLLVDHPINPDTARAARNIPGVDVKPASTLNVVDVLNHDVLIFSVEGIRLMERLLSHADA